MLGSVRLTLPGLVLQFLLLQFHVIVGQQVQLLLARPQRSSFEPSVEHLGHMEHPEHLEHLEHLEQPLPPLGWNTIGGSGGLGSGIADWVYNPMGLGHMSKDELLTLLEAWKEVEQEQEQESSTTPAPPTPPDTTTRRPPPIPPPPPPPPRPIVLPAPVPAPPAPAPVPVPVPALPPAPIPQIPPGTSISVRLPAFVPVRLAAMFTPPAGVLAPGLAPAGVATPGVAQPTGGGGGDDLATDDTVDGDEAPTPRLFRFMPMPRPLSQVRANSQARSRSQPRQQVVVRNTLDSVDVGTAPVRNLVRPEVRPAAAPSSKAKPMPAPASSPFRPRFGLPPHLAHARFELVPSSQIIGEWRE
ncbi:hypothetical protein KR009_003746 [Drosophila setifemur]|nr:hypothetical protein KR009_003746 [Drosophila setifemur]